MRTLGLIGGISWVSTLDYYRYINQLTNERSGGNEFARCIIHSLNYGDVIRFGEANDMDGLRRMVAGAAQGLERSGAEGLVLCANTMHRIADHLRPLIGIPIIHIASATAEVIFARGMKKVCLLGTRFTMELDFFTKHLKARGIEAIIPEEADRAFIHTSIHAELGKGLLLPDTKARYQRIIADMTARGAEGTILGCTEIPLLIKPEDVVTPIFDTTYIHSKAAVEFALAH